MSFPIFMGGVVREITFHVKMYACRRVVPYLYLTVSDIDGTDKKTTFMWLTIVLISLMSQYTDECSFKNEAII